MKLYEGRHIIELYGDRHMNLSGGHHIIMLCGCRHINYVAAAIYDKVVATI